jgi:hypothetical protein
MIKLTGNSVAHQNRQNFFIFETIEPNKCFAFLFDAPFWFLVNVSALVLIIHAVHPQ